MSTAGEHDDEMNFVPILDGFGEFIRVGAGMIEIDFNDVVQLIFLGKNGLFHSWILLDEMIQTFTNGISLHCNGFLPIGKTTMCCMNMYLDRHIFFLVPE